MNQRFLSAMSQLMDVVLFIWLRALSLLRKKNKQKTNKLLLLHFGHLGDFILWLDSARMYRELYPDKEITLMLEKHCDVSVIAKTLPYFDRVIVVDASWKRRISELAKLTRQGYDLVINVRTSRTVRNDLFVMAPRSLERYAPTADLTMISQWALHFSDKIYSKIIPCNGIQEMELIRNAQIIRQLGAADFKAQIPEIPRLTDYSVCDTSYFAICPGADGIAKRWPIENFCLLITAIIEKTDLTCVVLGTPGETDLQEYILQNSEHVDKIVPLCGSTSLLEFIDVIRDARFVVSSDSGSAHVGPAVRTKTFTIGSGWDKGRFFPYKVENEITAGLPSDIAPNLDCLGCGSNPAVTGKKDCMWGNTMKCVAQVSVHMVMDEIMTY